MTSDNPAHSRATRSKAGRWSRRGLVTPMVASLVATVGAVSVAGVSWVVMWQVNSWLTPIPYQPPKVDVQALADPEGYARGKVLYLGTCSACHGETGLGMPNSGKPLLGSAFVAAKDEKQLLTFLKLGRSSWDPENTTGIDMPAKGGNPVLNEDNLKDIVVFLKGMQTIAP